jgi:EmrB/QacA subfamily drug resistance transporter
MSRQADNFPTDASPDPKRWKALVVCLMSGFMTLLDVSIVNVALPTIQTALHAGVNDLQWIVSGYALALGLFLVPAGRLGDARGRRTVWMVGVGLFVLASAACGAAPTATFLVIARVVQGFAGGLVTPQVSGFIQTLFRGEERGRAFGLFGAVVGISTAVGPLLGGLLIAAFGEQNGWRAVFFVNLPIGAVALWLGRRYLPAPSRRPAHAPRTDLDPLGVLLLGLAVVCVLVPLIEQHTWDSPLRPLLYPISALFGFLWVVHERRYGREHEPVMSLDLFRIRSYVLGIGIGLVYFAGFTGTFFILTQYLQIGLKYTALQAGIAATPFALGSALTAQLGSRQVLRRGRKLIAFGLATVLVGLALVWLGVRLEPGNHVAYYIALPLLIAGLGGGLVIAPNQTLSLSEVPTRRAGSAGGALQTAQRIGSSAGIAITGSVFYSHLATSHGDFATAFRIGLVVIGVIIAAALVLAIADALTGTPTGTHPSTAQRPEGMASDRPTASDQAGHDGVVTGEFRVEGKRAVRPVAAGGSERTARWAMIGDRRRGASQWSSWPPLTSVRRSPAWKGTSFECGW